MAGGRGGSAKGRAARCQCSTQGLASKDQKNVPDPFSSSFLLFFSGGEKRVLQVEGVGGIMEGLSEFYPQGGRQDVETGWKRVAWAGLSARAAERSKESDGETHG